MTTRRAETRRRATYGRVYELVRCVFASLYEGVSVDPLVGLLVHWSVRDHFLFYWNQRKNLSTSLLQHGRPPILPTNITFSSSSVIINLDASLFLLKLVYHLPNMKQNGFTRSLIHHQPASSDAVWKTKVSFPMIFTGAQRRRSNGKTFLEELVLFFRR